MKNKLLMTIGTLRKRCQKLNLPLKIQTDFLRINENSTKFGWFIFATKENGKQMRWQLSKYDVDEITNELIKFNNE